MTKLTEYLDHEVDKAHAIYHATDKTLGAKVDELQAVVAALVSTVRPLAEAVSVLTDASSVLTDDLKQRLDEKMRPSGNE